MNVQARKLGLASLAMALIVLLGASSLAYQEWKQFREASAGANQAQRALTISHNLLRQLLQPENGQRGLEQVLAEINDLKQIAGGRSAQLARLQRLQELISANTEGENDRTMTRILRILEQIRGEENARFTAALADVDKSARSAGIIVSVSGVLIALLVSAGILALVRSQARAERSSSDPGPA